MQPLPREILRQTHAPADRPSSDGPARQHAGFFILPWPRRVKARRRECCSTKRTTIARRVPNRSRDTRSRVRLFCGSRSARKTKLRTRENPLQPQFDAGFKILIAPASLVKLHDSFEVRRCHRLAYARRAKRGKNLTRAREFRRSFLRTTITKSDGGSAYRPARCVERTVIVTVCRCGQPLNRNCPRSCAGRIASGPGPRIWNAAAKIPPGPRPTSDHRQRT